MEANLNRNTKKRSATAPITEQLKKTNIRNQVPSKKFYAVAIGHEPGVYETWDECQKQVSLGDLTDQNDVSRQRSR